MDKRQCDCCGAGKIAELGIYGEYQHFRCEDCGYESFNRNDFGVTAGLYENDADYDDDLSVVTCSQHLILWHHLKAIEYLRSKFQSSKILVLDVGCFNGFFVKKLLSLGYDAQGVDFNKSAIKYGKEQLGLGSKISTRTIEDVIAQGKLFDVVTLFEVLEHLPDAQTFLGNVTKLLKEGGVIILSTPNNNMCWRPPLDYPPHHLSRFTTKSLDACLSKLGMKTLFVAEQMSSYELIRHYVGTFFRAKDSGSLRGGEFKHKKITIFLRRGMNKMRKVLGILLTPLDKLLYMFGVRYISQIIIAEKLA